MKTIKDYLEEFDKTFGKSKVILRKDYDDEYEEYEEVNNIMAGCDGCDSNHEIRIKQRAFIKKALEDLLDDVPDDFLNADDAYDDITQYKKDKLRE